MNCRISWEVNQRIGCKWNLLVPRDAANELATLQNCPKSVLTQLVQLALSDVAFGSQTKWNSIQVTKHFCKGIIIMVYDLSLFVFGGYNNYIETKWLRIILDFVGFLDVLIKYMYCFTQIKLVVPFLDDFENIIFSKNECNT